MSGEIIFSTSQEFISFLNKEGIKKIAFSEIKERRAIQTKEDLLEVVVVKKVDLLAYRGAVIYKCSLSDLNLDELYSELTENGFDVTRRSRNIT